MFQKLDKEIVKKVVDTIIANFEDNEEIINNLNVFPVPDGDTGTNMLLTLKSIQKEINKLKNYNIKNISESVSFGALMGARGNSGVILSQILKGFFDIIMQEENLDLALLKEALSSSKNLAYTSVQNPTEGTMLTTIKDIYQSVEELSNGSKNSIRINELMDTIIKETEESVTRTTYLLPVLKEADVVDAGAQGLLVMLNGFKEALNGLGFTEENIEKGENKKEREPKQKKEEEPEQPRKVNSKAAHSMGDDADLKYMYCTELIVKGERINIERLRERIKSYGDCTMVVGDKKVVKIHVHTNHPHRVLKRAISEGTLHEIQINNMVEQSKAKKFIEEKVKKEEKVSILSVVNGEGLVEIYKSIGTDYVIPGGQTMNPSTYDLVKVINKIDADKIILLPNNKNIVPTAEQAKRISKREIEVVPTVTITQGITALLNYNPDLELDENIFNMKEAIKNVKSGEVTAAVRDANLLVGEIKKGAFIGMFDGKVKVISDSLVEATVDLVRDMIDKNDEVITFYAGKDANQEDNKKIIKNLNEKFPDIEVELHEGDQPLYPYLFSIE